MTIPTFSVRDKTITHENPTTEPFSSKGTRMTKEALKMALEALGNAWTEPGNKQYELEKEAITAIKEALAQPEQDGQCKRCTDGCTACDAKKLPAQEPVAWAKFSAKGNIIDLLNEPDDEYTPLYTTPPKEQAEPVQERITHITWDERGVRTVNGIPDDAPQRPWVGLTPEEVKHLYPYGRSVWGRETFEAIEAKLKDKNGF